MIKTSALTCYRIIKWAKGRVIQSSTIFKFLDFTAAFTQPKAHLLDGMDRECGFQIQTLNSLSIPAQGFLCMNTGSWINSIILILLALNARISYEWLFQNLWTIYVSKSVGWNLSDGRNAHEHSTFINPSNSVF